MAHFQAESVVDYFSGVPNEIASRIDEFIAEGSDELSLADEILEIEEGNYLLTIIIIIITIITIIITN